MASGPAPPISAHDARLRLLVRAALFARHADDGASGEWAQKRRLLQSKTRVLGCPADEKWRDHRKAGRSSDPDQAIYGRSHRLYSEKPRRAIFPIPRALSPAHS